MQARELMKAQELRKSLDLSDPNRDFQYYFDKYKIDKKTGRQLSDDEVYKKIIEKSTITNKKADRMAGVTK